MLRLGRGQSYESLKMGEDDFPIGISVTVNLVRKALTMMLNL